MKNTAIEYRYTDGSNYKVSRTAVFSGGLSEDKLNFFLGHLMEAYDDELGRFIPGQVGLDDLQNKMNEDSIKFLEASLKEQEGDAVQMSGEDKATLTNMLNNIKNTRPIWWPDDVPSHELLSVEPTDLEPTDPRSIDFFFEQWMEVDWDEGYLPPFYDEMYANYEAHLAAQEEDAVTPAP